MWGGKATLRKIWVIIQQLPPNSALLRKIVPDQWTATDYLLANVIDVLQNANWQRGADPKKPGPLPSPFPRPGETERKQAEAEDRAAQWRRDKEGGG